jgi:hypothetical protein
MKITGIDKAKSKQSQLALQTDPPLTPEVFDRFLEVWQVDGFSLQGDLLFWEGSMGIDGDFIEETALYLTEAERQLAETRTSGDAALDAFLRKKSKETGLPLL